MGQTEWSTLVESICAERGLSVVLSWDMPQGYETANGTFDPVAKTLFLNPAVLQSAPEYEAMFYLVHELRHAEQYQHPERFDAMIRVSLPYVVLYDGTCFRLRGETWQECRLDGGEERFRDAYLGFPYEVDANEFAAQRVKAFCGDSPALRQLRDCWRQAGCCIGPVGRWTTRDRHWWCWNVWRWPGHWGCCTLSHRPPGRWGSCPCSSTDRWRTASGPTG